MLNQLVKSIISRLWAANWTSKQFDTQASLNLLHGHRIISVELVSFFLNTAPEFYLSQATASASFLTPVPLAVVCLCLA